MAECSNKSACQARLEVTFIPNEDAMIELFAYIVEIMDVVR